MNLDENYSPCALEPNIEQKEHTTNKKKLFQREIKFNGVPSVYANQVFHNFYARLPC